jgi:hypothetical protein
MGEPSKVERDVSLAGRSSHEAVASDPSDAVYRRGLLCPIMTLANYRVCPARLLSGGAERAAGTGQTTSAVAPHTRQRWNGRQLRVAGATRVAPFLLPVPVPSSRSRSFFPFPFLLPVSFPT